MGKTYPVLVAFLLFVASGHSQKVDTEGQGSAFRNADAERENIAAAKDLDK